VRCAERDSELRVVVSIMPMCMSKIPEMGEKQSLESAWNITEPNHTTR
jgi:hypothetical protein